MKKLIFYFPVILLICISFIGCDKSETTDPTKVTAVFSADKQSGDSPLNVQFTNTSANAESYAWDFGDGSTSVEKDPAHVFTNSSATDSKSFTVSLKTTAADKTTADATTIITVNKTAMGTLTASFTVDKETGESPLTIQFTNTSTGADSYRWDFGDGQSTTAKDPTHVYFNNSLFRDTTFMISLMSRDASFNIANANAYITVKKVTTSTYPAPEFNPSLTYGTINDIDGNIIKTISIGGKAQVWMAENLRVTKFNDGSEIPFILKNDIWKNLSTPGFGWFNNNTTAFMSGGLYNWYAVDPASNGNKNICPSGWHIPSDEEWMTLVNFLGGTNVAGGKIKETGTTHWISPNEGATNESGFTALNAGHRSSNNGQSYDGEMGFFWSSTIMTTHNAYSYSLSPTNAKVIREGSSKGDGLSIRCIKD